jgi:hypothetical protein
MTIEHQQESPALSLLRDFIQELRSTRCPEPSVFEGLKTLEITLETLADEEQLQAVGQIIAEWITALPRDFEHPTFEQLLAHIIAVMFSMSKRFHRARIALEISRDRRPEALRDNLAFLRDYAAARALDRAVIPDFKLQDGFFRFLAHILKRALVDIIHDDEMTPEAFGRLPIPRLILELYKRQAKLGEKYKEGEESLEYKLRRSGVLRDLCRQHVELVEFLGPRGLGIYIREGWWNRLWRKVRRTFIEVTLPRHWSDLLSWAGIIVIVILLNFVLFMGLWNPKIQNAEKQIQKRKTDIVNSVSSDIKSRSRGRER